MERQDCCNTSTVEERIDATIVPRSKMGEDNPQAGLNISILACPQLSKLTKRHLANITSPRKHTKFDAEAIAEVEDILSTDEGSLTTLLQYALTPTVIRRLGGL